MALAEITAKNFESTIEQDGIVLIDFWAPWCGPCRAFGPIFERVAGKHADLTFAKVNTEQEQALAQQFGIRSIPTLALFKNGVEADRVAGALDAANLKSWLMRHY